MSRAGLALVLLGLIGCGAPPAAAAMATGTRTGTAAASTTATTSTTAMATTTETEMKAGTAASPSFLALDVPGFLPAVLSLPSSSSPRPLLVVAHGAGGRPEPHCAFFRELLGDRAVILCPRGFALSSLAPPGESEAFFFPDHHALDREVTAALSALAAAFPDRVDLRAPAYAGFSQGAVMGALAFVTPEARFARALFIEGGVGEHDEWTLARARAFHEGGGARVVLACGRPSCARAAFRTAGFLARAELDVRVAYGEGAGHTYGGAVAGAVAEALPWLFEGDPRWSD